MENHLPKINYTLTNINYSIKVEDLQSINTLNYWLDNQLK